MRVWSHVLNDSLSFNGPVNARWTLLLTHGAGASTASNFFTAFSERLLERGVEIGGLRLGLFDFPYMKRRALTGKMYFPDKMPVLQRSYLDAIDASGSEANRLVIGGKSMGGRVASLIADDAEVAALVCLGYPFHPRGRPEKLRTDHLEQFKKPALICQGTRDPQGGVEEVKGYNLSSSIQLKWLSDGDHDLVPRKRSGHTRAENWDAAAAAVIQFIRSLP